MTTRGGPPVRETACSAPGKVLVTGGYLVLDRAYAGCVLAVDAHFTTTVRDVHVPVDKDKATALHSTLSLVIRSPQFDDTERVYAFDVRNGTLQDESVGHSSPNRYLECSINNALAVSRHQLGGIAPGALSVTIVADNDFYSQRAELDRRGLPVTVDALRALPQHCAQHTTLDRVHKTGLGSSAALVTSLVAALLLHLRVVGSDEQKGESGEESSLKLSTSALLLVHNVAQLSHCQAQGKIGSGFDVSNAVYGSQLFQRFSPSVIEPALVGTLDAAAITDIVTAPWDGKAQPFQLPPHIHLVLADVQAGSNTPKMVSRVLAWCSANPDHAKRIWTALDENNVRVHKELGALCAMAQADETGYAQSVLEFGGGSKLTASSIVPKSPVMEALRAIRAAFEENRALYRELSRRADVGIEPPEQTRLLDETIAECPGVLIAGVPGAGGYDAIFALTVGPATNADQVQRYWAARQDMTVTPLVARQADGAGLRVATRVLDGGAAE